MKSIALLITLISTVSFAGTGWFSDYVIINKNATGSSYYWIGSNPSFGTEFNTHAFGTVTSLVITGADMKYWSDNQDRTGGSFFWIVKSSDGNTIIKSASEQIWTQSGPVGNDYQGLWSGTLDILSGLSASTTYQLHVYAKSWGTSQGDSWLTNGGANYVATFTTDASLPVELASFTSLINHNSVKLSWQTITEVNNYGFEIERASVIPSGVEGWEKLGFVQGNGNSNSPKNYTFTDSPIGGTKFQYRLKQIDFDGKFDYSNIIEAELVLPESFSVQQNFPNPFNPTTTIKYELPQNSFVSIKIYDSIGRELKSLVNQNQDQGVQQVTFDAGELPSGIYYYTLKAGNYSASKKMLLIK
jgi:hypothetical protein